MMYTYTPRAIHLALALGALLGSLASCSLFEAPLVAPSRVTASRSGTTIHLTWQNNAPSSTRTVVERAAPGADFAERVSLGPNQSQHSDTVDQDGNWRYRIRVENGRSQSRSEVVSVFVTGTGSGSVESNWDPTGWSLAWSDEFNGPSLNTTDWTVETGTGPGGDGWGNQELQFYRQENISFVTDAGRQTLLITAKKNDAGQAYTSARLKTQGKQNFLYGRVEAALKLPRGKGIWPAFWMLGETISTVGWPRSGEIDIMEMVGGNTADHNNYTTHGTIHYADGNNVRQYVGKKTALALVNGAQPEFADGYHLFGVEWSSTEIKWYLDGTLFHTEAISAADRSEFRDPGNRFFILLNLAVGGQWPGDPDGNTVFPQRYYIDWVRVWEKE